jgi:hypothetical protein
MVELPNRQQSREEPALNISAFRDIHPEQLPRYIKEAKTVVMEGLRERLQREADASEVESLAFTIGTLSELERIVDRWRSGVSPRR